MGANYFLFVGISSNYFVCVFVRIVIAIENAFDKEMFAFNQ